MKKADFHLDLRGNISPVSLLKATKALAHLKAGERLEILGTDDQTQKELFEVLDPQQVRTVEVWNGKSCYRIILEKRRCDW